MSDDTQRANRDHGAYFMSVNGGHGFLGVVTVANTPVVSSDVAEPQRDERLIGQLIDVFDTCWDQGVNAHPVRDEIEQVIQAGNGLREAGKDLRQKDRRVIIDGIHKVLREAM